MTDPATAGEGSMIDIVVNGEHRTVDAAVTVADLVAQIASTTRGIAVAVDGNIVPRSTWESTRAPDNCKIEIITAVAGG